MTAVIYARYSSNNQREESIEGQIRECTAYAEKNGITVIKHYIDRAFSAKTDNRPEFQQMIKDSEKRLFDIVLVWKLDRFARNRYDSAHYEYQLERNHVKLVSATEPISDSPAGIMVKSMLTGMAEYYEKWVNKNHRPGGWWFGNRVRDRLHLETGGTSTGSAGKRLLDLGKIL